MIFLLLLLLACPHQASNVDIARYRSFIYLVKQLFALRIKKDRYIIIVLRRDMAVRPRGSSTDIYPRRGKTTVVRVQGGTSQCGRTQVDPTKERRKQNTAGPNVSEPASAAAPAQVPVRLRYGP